MKKMDNQVYQFKIALKGITPQVWRRIRVPETYTFWDLHVAIQSAMDWGGHHLHEFTILNPKTGEMDVIGIPHEDFDEREVLEGWKIKIARYFSMTNKKADYLYDFGDYWEHSIVLEKILPKDSKTRYPCCIAGKRSSPPDDVGGIPGFEEFVEIMKDSSHEEHDEMVEWYCDEFDPEAFNCKDVTFLDPAEMLRLMNAGQ
jgi:hypothetical protein